MTTLSLSRADHGEQRFAVSLQDWLHGHWGLLFSHPTDFAVTDLETDRWLAVTANAFAQRHIRAIALDSSQQRYDLSWIAQICGYETAVFLDSGLPSYSDETEFNAIVLASAISRAPSRFVMIVDSNLRLRRTFTYGKGDRVPSVLDFVALIDQLAKPAPTRAEPPAIGLHRYALEAPSKRIAAYV
jgi:alkyl hydroperoxide reductase subunit AhpC